MNGHVIPSIAPTLFHLLGFVPRLHVPRKLGHGFVPRLHVPRKLGHVPGAGLVPRLQIAFEG